MPDYIPKLGVKVEYQALRQPGRIGSLELPHRILMGSMHMSLESQPDALDRLCEFYRARVRGGAALIITGGVAVNEVGGGENMYVLTREQDIADLTKVAEAVRDVGGRVALQLFHSGRYVSSQEIGMPAVAPSAVASRLTRETPREMSVIDIKDTIDAFAAGAVKAKAMGFDAVEIMGSEGYLLNEFLSPLTNQRSDDYGGALENRMRISLEVVKSIRDAVGLDYPIIFRMSGFDGMPGGTADEESDLLAQALEKAGVDALNIGIGWHESRVPTVQQVVPRGGFATIAGRIKSRVSIPILGANRINTPEIANSLVADGFLDFVAPARPWLADERFAAKALRGDRNGLNVCIACNQSCLDHTLVRPQQPVSCLVNPRAGQERLWPLDAFDPLDPALAPAPAYAAARATSAPHATSTGPAASSPHVTASRRVAVVGAGPAGLQAALTASLRGHAVTLFEKQAEIGGQFRMAARVPGKDEFYETIRYYGEMLERLSVTVKMQTEPTADELATFDAVILAHGVVPRVPDIPGVDLPHVVTYAQILNGCATVGHNIAIIGAGGIGCDVATYLAEGGHASASVQSFFAHAKIGQPFSLPRSVTVLNRSPRYGGGIGPSTRWVVKQEMDRLGVKLVTNFTYRAIEQDGVRGEVDGNEVFVPADQIVLCAGQESGPSLQVELEDRVPVYVVGGGRESKGINAARAIREAMEAAYQI